MRRRISSHCVCASLYGLHILGLEEKTWKALHPSRYALSAAVSTPPAVEVCMPIFRDVSFGGSAGAGRLKMSFDSLLQECFTAGLGIAAKYLILTELKGCIHHRDSEKLVICDRMIA